MNVISHPTAQHFLNAHSGLFSAHELKCNMVIGNCNNLPDPAAVVQNAHFMGTGTEQAAHAVAVRILPKAMVNVFVDDNWSAKALAAYYAQHDPNLAGIVGDERLASDMAAAFPRSIALSRVSLVQAVDKVNKVKVGEGVFTKAAPLHSELVNKWAASFLTDERIVPVRSPEQINTLTSGLIAGERLFIWEVKGEPVCMGAMIRKTNLSGIIGLVYTPPEHRGKGFAKGLMHALSNHIIASGKKYSGLIVYENNQVASGIYTRIGYQTVCRFMDIDFA